MTLALPTLARTDSWLARRDPRARLIAFLVFALSSAAIRTPTGGILALAAAGLAAQLAPVPRRVQLGRGLMLILPTLPVLIVGPLFTPIPDWPAALALLLRVTAIGTAGLALVWAAPLSQTFTAAQALGVPAKLVEVARLADRYTTTLFAEIRRVRVALRVRGFRVTTNRHTYQTLGATIGGLLLRTETRADRIAAAMQTRGFTTSRPPTPTGPLTIADGFLVVATLSVACLALLA